MKNTWRIAVVAALALCLLMAFVACNSDGDGDTIVYVTDTNGETVTDTAGKPVTMVVESTDDSSSSDSDGQSSSTDSNGEHISNGGADTDGEWSMIYPTKPK